MKILSQSLRPRTLSALYGQDSTIKAIRTHMAARQPQAWLFHGPSGTGKTTIAGILAMAFQCDHMPIWGDPCAECWKHRSEFAIHEINASSVSGIEELKQIVELSRFSPTAGHKRVIILDEAQKISNSAQNMLLDPTEKPPAHLVWIICTTEISKLLVTLRRRFVTYQMKPLGISATEKFLSKQAGRVGIKRDLSPLYEQCHVLGINAPAMLLMALEKYAAGASAVEATSGIDESGIDSLRICKAVTSGDWKVIAATLKDATPDQARWIQASVLGWLKGVMARETAAVGLDRASVSILELCAPPYDEAARIHWLWATLWKISRRYAR